MLSIGVLHVHVGVYPVRPPLPTVAGYEGVGEVHSIGSAVQGLSPGDLVMASPPSPGRLLISINDDSFVVQATNPCTYKSCV